MSPAEQFTRFLSSHRLKVTSERVAVAEAIAATRGHFDVDALLDRLRRRRVPVSRATLYRTLPHLVEAGIVHRLTGPDGQSRYESMAGRRHHDHMICLRCGEIAEFESSAIERLQEAACRKRQFTMTGHVLRIEGFCRRCAASPDPGDADV